MENTQLTKIFSYFPDLSDEQRSQLSALGELYTDWNAKINVISRKDIDNLYQHHVLHSLGITKMLNFKDDSSVLDIGTGGGFPGIPLAILFPNVHFSLIDGTAKKIRVVQAVVDALGLKNVDAKQQRMEEERRMFDFAVSRAVMPLSELVKGVKKNILRQPQHNALPNGLICLKGGELNEELKPFVRQALTLSLSDYFTEEYYITKRVVYVPL